MLQNISDLHKGRKETTGIKKFAKRGYFTTFQIKKCPIIDLKSVKSKKNTLKMSHLDYKKKKKEKKDVKLEEVFIIRQKLEKITKSGGGQDQALDLLERLGEIDMNFAILKETMIGFTVHALKKSSSDEEIILKSKTLIKVRMI